MLLGEGLCCEICMGDCICVLFLLLFFLYNDLKISGADSSKHLFLIHESVGCLGQGFCFRSWVSSGGAPRAAPGARGPLFFSGTMAEMQGG